MQRYANRGGDSGVVAYQTSEDSITVEFRDGTVYLYNYESTTKDVVEHMKLLAEQGQGLNAFITRNVGKRYARKVK